MADFPITPDYVVSEIADFAVAVSKFENGSDQRRRKSANPTYRFRLGFINRTETDYDTLKAFFIAKYGATTGFTFNNPNDGVDYNVRFGGPLESEYKSYKNYNLSCDLISTCPPT